jgi:hypothetical protein
LAKECGCVANSYFEIRRYNLNPRKFSVAIRQDRKDFTELVNQ